MNQRLRVMVFVNFTVVVIMAVWGFVLPGAIVLREVGDPGLSDGSIPRFVFRRHEQLAPRFASWARDRVASGKATRLGTEDVAGTEWPIFGSVFFLWTTEALQEAWAADPSLSKVEPKSAAHGAIEAAVDLIADPNHAAWVKKRWGPDYLKRENLFYRMLLISGLTGYRKLTGETRYLPLLRDQVESLAKELDESPHGLLDDYPGECYPIDIVPAIAAIRRADSVLGTDHSAFVARAVRGFEGLALDAETGLPAYDVSKESGRAAGPARGIGISYMLIWAPHLWPETARRWFTAFESRFRQTDRLLEGFREYPTNRTAQDWSMDVDAGPVIAGYGTAASAFGIGATRANGRLDLAFGLSAEALAASWPLPDGSMLIPRILSNVADSPYLGESALLFCFSRRPAEGFETTLGTGRILWFVRLMILFYEGMGLLVILSAIQGLKRWTRGGSGWVVPFLRIQFGVWVILSLSGVGALIVGRSIPGLILLLSAQLFPRLARIVAPVAATSPPDPDPA